MKRGPRIARVVLVHVVLLFLLGSLVTPWFSNRVVEGEERFTMDFHVAGVEVDQQRGDETHAFVPWTDDDLRRDAGTAVRLIGTGHALLWVSVIVALGIGQVWVYAAIHTAPRIERQAMFALGNILVLGSAALIVTASGLVWARNAVRAAGPDTEGATWTWSIPSIEFGGVFALLALFALVSLFTVSLAARDPNPDDAADPPSEHAVRGL